MPKTTLPAPSRNSPCVNDSAKARHELARQDLRAGQRRCPETLEGALATFGHEQPADGQDQKERKHDGVRGDQPLIVGGPAVEEARAALRDVSLSGAGAFRPWLRTGQRRPGLGSQVVLWEHDLETCLDGGPEQGGLADLVERLADHPGQDHAQQRHLGHLLDDGGGGALRRVGQHLAIQALDPHRGVRGRFALGLAELVQFQLDPVAVEGIEAVGKEGAAVHPVTEVGAENQDRCSLAAADQALRRSRSAPKSSTRIPAVLSRSSLTASAQAQEP